MKGAGGELVLVEYGSRITSEVAHFSAETGCQVIPVVPLNHERGFPKSRLLNTGLAATSRDFVMAFDADLAPYPNVLQEHVRLAAMHGDLCVSGYRVMLARGEATLEFDGISEANIAPEDRPSALAKYLGRSAAFGVLPCFQRRRVIQLGGWDEKFEGWGGEDEDMIERYCATGVVLVRAHRLLYVHSYHEPRQGWGSQDLTETNRTYLAEKRSRRRSGNA